MAKILLLVFGVVLESAIKRLLLAAGLGLVSMVSIQTYFDTKIEEATRLTGQFDNWILGLMAVGKIDTCLSILVGAIAARVVISSASLTLSKIK